MIYEPEILDVNLNDDVEKLAKMMYFEICKFNSNPEFRSFRKCAPI